MMAIQRFNNSQLTSNRGLRQLTSFSLPKCQMSQHYHSKPAPKLSSGYQKYVIENRYGGVLGISNSRVGRDYNVFNMSVVSKRHSGRLFSSGSKFEYTAEQRAQDHKHCVELVQTRDMEGYLCGLLMPSSAREAYFALRAFNVEIASIKDASRLVGGRAKRGNAGFASTGGNSNNDGQSLHSVFEDDLDNNAIAAPVDDTSIASRMRMQWWHDAIAEIYDNIQNNNFDNADVSSPQPAVPYTQEEGILHSLTSSRKHNPTLRSLTDAIQKHGLTHRFLQRMMEAREVDLGVVQYQQWRDVAKYGEETVSSCLYLSLECVGVRDEPSDMVASDIGVALGLITSLRSTAFRAMQGECSIPLDLAQKYNISMETLFRVWEASNHHDGENTADRGLVSDRSVGDVKEAQSALQNATQELAHVALHHLHRARQNQGVVPKQGRPSLLPAVCGLHYLTLLEECDYNVFHPALIGGAGDNEDINASVARERRRKLNLMFLLGRAWLTGTF